MQNDNNFRVMTGEELYSYRREAIVNNPNLDPATYVDGLTGIAGYYASEQMPSDYKTTDFVDLYHRTAVYQDYNISASGGNDKMNFYTSFNYTDKVGIQLMSDLKKIGFRTNFNAELNNKLELGVKLNISYQDFSDGESTSWYWSNPTFASLRTSPFDSPYNDDGTLNYQMGSNGNYNILAYDKYVERNDRTYKTIGTFH
ncbi:MAG: hypothetical protein HC831_27485 [Chloroflexia bacterium]|nr:hypothetical protein [Chloroflexia bacterium]